MNKRIITILFLSFILSACSTVKLTTFDDFEKPVDTSDREVQVSPRQIYAIPDLKLEADNRFKGARLDGFFLKNDGTVVARIEPENRPINPSPWYAFRLYTEQPQTIQLLLDYSGARHRYHPKVSRDGLRWALVPDADVQAAGTDGKDALLTLHLPAGTTWLAGQEVVNSSHVFAWLQEQDKKPDTHLREAGRSREDRPLYCMEINKGNEVDKELIVIISRQHPPEVTGYFAMQSFVETILEDTPLARDFRKKYRILVFPLMNPDGVDNGHWRHNMGGVDTNRDWAYYRQPEIQQFTSYIVEQVNKYRHNLILGMDFHSTHSDLYYTHQEGMGQKIAVF